jgi:hypothetical protein
MWRLYTSIRRVLDWQLDLLDHNQLHNSVTVYTLYNSQQLSLFSSSEHPGSNSATTAATNSYGVPCHHSLTGNWSELCTILTQSKSKLHCDRRPVGQCVLVSSPVWGSWPDVNYCLTVELQRACHNIFTSFCLQHSELNDILNVGEKNFFWFSLW